MYTIIKWIYQKKIVKNLIYKMTQIYYIYPKRILSNKIFLWNSIVSMFVPTIKSLYYWYFSYYWIMSMYMDAGNYLVCCSSAPHHTPLVPWSPQDSSSRADRCPPCCWRDTDSLRRWSCCSPWEWPTRPRAHRSILHRTKGLVISLIKTANNNKLTKRVPI